MTEKVPSRKSVPPKQVLAIMYLALKAVSMPLGVQSFPFNSMFIKRDFREFLRI